MDDVLSLSGSIGGSGDTVDVLTLEFEVFTGITLSNLNAGIAPRRYLALEAQVHQIIRISIEK